MTTPTIITVPLDKLLPGDKAKGGSINSRKADAPVEGLAASIATHGLLVPLLVRRGDNGSFYVMDGHRRLAAAKGLAKKDAKLFAGGVPCIPNDHNNALELSMVVNVDRAELHPVDRFEVFAALVQAGDTVDAVAKRYGMKTSHVRQALALGRMAPAVRDAWRAGDLDAETAETFTLTSDHKAQAAALKKVGKYGSAWTVRKALTGQDRPDVGAMLALAGRAEYEKAGHHVNGTLFSESDRDTETVSDYPALVRMVDDKLEAKCAELVKQGWKWAILRPDAPKDLQAWHRVHPAGGHYTKEQMAALGCVICLDWSNKLDVQRGYQKPGDKGVATPKSPKQKKVEAKKREERKEETGGISNALAMRLSDQLTRALREALPAVPSAEVALSLTIAVLAAENEATPHLKLGLDRHDEEGDGREDNDFGKYLKLALSKSPRERVLLLLTWVAKAIDVRCHNGADLLAVLHPGKDHDQAAGLIAESIDGNALVAAARKHFDAADYFASVSKEMIVEAVTEALGKDHAARVAKMKAGEAREYAVKHVPKTGWVPTAMRLGKA